MTKQIHKLEFDLFVFLYLKPTLWLQQRLPFIEQLYNEKNLEKRVKTSYDVGYNIANR